ncbi:MAG: hypothetical protein ACOY9J_06420 [Pseudomonadota bacterium]
MQALEARIAQLETVNTDSVASQARDTGIKINGFMSAGATYLDDDTVVYDAGMLSSNVNWIDSSRVGLQFDMPVNEKTSALVQLLALGADDFSPYLPLAYISYRPTPRDEFRAGRVRAPFFMLSEYLDVGYVYPWARPPLETYSAVLPINMEGISWSHKFITDAWVHDVQFVFGETNVDIPGLSGHLDDLSGVNLMSTHGDWLLRAGYLQTTSANASTASGPLQALQPFGVIDMTGADASFGGLGVQYDNGSLLASAEYTVLQVEGWFPDNDSSSLTLGYRFGKLMPSLTFAESRVTDKSVRGPNSMFPLLCDQSTGMGCLGPNPALPGTYIPYPADLLNKVLDSEQQSVTLGLRYDYLPNASVKFDVSAVTDTGETWGALTPLDTNGFGGSFDEQLFGKPDTPVMAYRLVFDVVF